MYKFFPVSELKKRWKNLKDSYRKELKKNPTFRLGDGEHQWRYFEHLSFLKDEIVPTPGESTLAETLTAEYEGDASIIDEDNVENIASPQDVSSPVSVQSPPSPRESQHKASRKRHTPNEYRAEYLEIEKRKLQILETEILQKGGPSSEKSDDYHFLMSILPEMEKLPPIQKMRLRNTINQALMDEMNISLYGESPICYDSSEDQSM